MDKEGNFKPATFEESHVTNLAWYNNVGNGNNFEKTVYGYYKRSREPRKNKFWTNPKEDDHL